MPERDTYKYQLRQGNRIVHRGVTNNLDRREGEHQAEYPGASIHQVGRRTTRQRALQWEREGGRRPYS